MKKYLILLTIFLLFVQGEYAQTNVSGGIYSNTTWTLAHSPYIVIDTIVVFPGVILTIETGVKVKFSENKIIEIRQAKLIADGTVNDSITFTSNASSPTPGIYSGIYLNGGNHTSIFNITDNYQYITSVNAFWLKSNSSKHSIPQRKYNAEFPATHSEPEGSCLYYNADSLRSLLTSCFRGNQHPEILSNNILLKTKTSLLR